MACSVAGIKGTPTAGGIPHTPSIIVKNSDSGDISSFQADVQVFSSIDRQPASPKLLEQYRLSVKLIGGEIRTRIDYPADSANGVAARTVIASPNEIVLMDTVSNSIIGRAPAPAEMAAQKDMPMRSLFQRADIPALIEKYRSMNYDVATNPESGRYVAVSMPSDLVLKTSNLVSQTTSFRLFLDLEEGTIAGSETISVETDGTVLTTKNTPIYQETNGLPVKVGDVTTIQHDANYTIDRNDSVIPPLPEDPTTVPALSESEYKTLLDAGQAIPLPEAMTGDPSNPDYTETIITVYDSIELNAAPDTLFRIAEGSQK